MGKIKIPCGGFVLDDSLTLDEENRLGVNWEKQAQSDWNQSDVTQPDDDGTIQANANAEN